MFSCTGAVLKVHTGKVLQNVGCHTVQGLRATIQVATSDKEIVGEGAKHCKQYSIEFCIKVESNT